MATFRKTQMMSSSRDFLTKAYQPTNVHSTRSHPVMITIQPKNGFADLCIFSMVVFSFSLLVCQAPVRIRITPHSPWTPVEKKKKVLISFSSKFSYNCMFDMLWFSWSTDLTFYWYMSRKTLPPPNYQVVFTWGSPGNKHVGRNPVCNIFGFILFPLL